MPPPTLNYEEPEIDDENKADIEASARYLESSQREPT